MSDPDIAAVRDALDWCRCAAGRCEHCESGRAALARAEARLEEAEAKATLLREAVNWLADQGATKWRTLSDG